MITICDSFSKTQSKMTSDCCVMKNIFLRHSVQKSRCIRCIQGPSVLSNTGCNKLTFLAFKIQVIIKLFKIPVYRGIRVNLPSVCPVQ